MVIFAIMSELEIENIFPITIIDKLKKHEIVKNGNKIDIELIITKMEIFITSVIIKIERNIENVFIIMKTEILKKNIIIIE